MQHTIVALSPYRACSNMNSNEIREQRNGLVMLAIVSLIVGAASGLLGTLFRFSLERADQLRDVLVTWARSEHAIGLVIVLLAASASTALAAWLVGRFAPEASGSGIPQVEAILNGDLPPARLSLIPVKFIGGVLAIGAGLALGREGPSVHMGAAIAHVLGKSFRRNSHDCMVLMAAGAGAGLATAFDAPIAGAVFVLEELTRRFDTRTAVAALGASASAIAVARLMHGGGAEFQLAVQPLLGFGTLPAHLLLGVTAGLLGVAYCRTILWVLAVSDQLAGCPKTARAAVVGAAVGVLAWYVPDMVGGGDLITQRVLANTGALSAIGLLFLVRFGLGAVSYAAGTPGGLFAPMLVLGAQTGLVFGRICIDWFPGVAAYPSAFAAVGMAAFFTAVVRAPITGIVLVTELTGSFTLLLPMLAACFTAMIVPIMLGCPPIYDSLARRQSGSGRSAEK
jgi:chloride channel protein, CIC family